MRLFINYLMLISVNKWKYTKKAPVMGLILTDWKSFKDDLCRKHYGQFNFDLHVKTFSDLLCHVVGFGKAKKV